MLLAFVIWGSIAACAASPLHKYPYVFLLDVGNEELEKTNTEQLRVSIPGGSLVMKYPAMGEGDPISHVRVSGIDFGTDLKVNIAEGGPGYKYVVLMFMGNPGVTYDAVVTLQTQQTFPTGMDINFTTTNKIGTTENFLENSYDVSEADNEGSDQDLVNDLKNMKQTKSKEVMQSTSTFYNYAKKEMAHDDEDDETENVSAEREDDSEDNDSTDEEDEEENEFSNNGHQRIASVDSHESSYQNERKDSNEDEAETEENENEDEESEKDENVKTTLYSERNYDPFRDTPRAEPYRYNVNLNNADNAKPDDIYDKYQDLKPHFGLGFRVYPQSFIYERQYQGNSDYSKENPVELGQFNSEELSNDGRFKDGSNSIDPDYLVAEY